jgi:hypothetical protein
VNLPVNVAQRRDSDFGHMAKRAAKTRPQRNESGSVKGDGSSFIISISLLAGELAITFEPSMNNNRLSNKRC